jgi:peptide/nickel transport system permease protein
MRNYVIKRSIHAIFITWLVSTVIFVGVRLIPGGPVHAMLGRRASQSQVEALRTRLGLNRPIHVQYVDFIQDLLVLDFGQSIRTSQEVTTIIMNALPKTAAIGVVGVLFGLLIAIPAGIISATRRGDPSDHAATTVAFLGLSAPAFFIGILLMVIFSVELGLLPVFGYTPLNEGLLPWFKSVLLPGISVGLPYTAVVMRMTRSSLLEVLGQPYMKTARAKGLNNSVRLYKHALQNALIPVVTVAGIQLAVIIGGVVTVEIVFGIKGMGRVVVQAILNRDYPVAQVAIMVLAIGFVYINLIVDLMYTFIDPRIKYGDEA